MLLHLLLADSIQSTFLCRNLRLIWICHYGDGGSSLSPTLKGSGRPKAKTHESKADFVTFVETKQQPTKAEVHLRLALVDLSTGQYRAAGSFWLNCVEERPQLRRRLIKLTSTNPEESVNVQVYTASQTRWSSQTLAQTRFLRTEDDFQALHILQRMRSAVEDEVKRRMHPSCLPIPPSGSSSGRSSSSGSSGSPKGVSGKRPRIPKGGRLLPTKIEQTAGVHDSPPPESGANTADLSSQPPAKVLQQIEAMKQRALDDLFEVEKLCCKLNVDVEELLIDEDCNGNAVVYYPLSELYVLRAWECQARSREEETCCCLTAEPLPHATNFVGRGKTAGAVPPEALQEVRQRPIVPSFPQRSP